MNSSSVSDLVPPRDLPEPFAEMSIATASVVMMRGAQSRSLRYWVACTCIPQGACEANNLDDALRVCAEHIYTHDDQLRHLNLPPAHTLAPAADRTPCRPVDEERRPGRHG